MNLTSPAFKHNGPIPAHYTCDGKNANPPLAWSGAPKETESFALIMDDPDAPRGTWVHWVLWNIDPSITSIAEHSVPTGAVQGMTSFGRSAYGGPCPPDREHRYFFKLYALDTLVSLPSSATKEKVERMMEGHILAQTELIGLYDRKR
ncbi:MAG: hypothetical protein A2808_00500 [Candidatus Moranbacteria bacterium RIFCSPHIGHO2_01_FULL_55_24]|nr:MAG: hypothetical protein A2808_00500 [Candidatus Moranbacteria bacterium RIFCSPHIGHO2_01_FULL_55_24]